MPRSRSSQRVRFVTTRWSLVGAAAHSNAEERRIALEQLCQHYWTPLYAFLRQQGMQRSEAQDVTQSFIVELLDNNTWAAAKQEQGRFRSFLLGCFKHFLSHHREKQQAKKRGGSKLHFSLYQQQGESAFESVSRMPTPDRAFEVAWLNVVLERVMMRFMEPFKNPEEQARIKKELPGIIGGAAAAGVKRTAAERQRTSRLRKRYRELLLEEVGDTVLTEAGVQEEVHELFRLASGQ
jgi:DNA-directed RNA polymerase specialized sigma24 family protein